MKYKNIELITGDDSEAELLCGVEYKETNEESEVIGDNLIEELLNLFKDFDEEIVIEMVDDGIINVRCWDITLDENGVKLLTKIYKTLIENEFITTNPKILIGVHVDSEEWFVDENGEEYNEDMVTLEEFLNNIKY